MAARCNSFGHRTWKWGALIWGIYLSGRLRQSLNIRFGELVLAEPALLIMRREKWGTNF
jgi:hypothetical protein